MGYFRQQKTRRSGLEVYFLFKIICNINAAIPYSIIRPYQFSPHRLNGRIGYAIPYFQAIVYYRDPMAN